MRTAFLALLIALLALTPMAYAKSDQSYDLTVYGEVDLLEGGKIQNVHIVDTTGSAPPEGHTPALDTKGTASIRGLLIENASVGVRASQGSEDIGRTYRFVFRSNTIQGNGTTSGLILDLPLHNTSSIQGNTFQRQTCGIDIGIDTVFAHLPPGERLKAFHDLEPQLKSQNTFEEVTWPVCGSFG